MAVPLVEAVGPLPTPVAVSPDELLVLAAPCTINEDVKSAPGGGGGGTSAGATPAPDQTVPMTEGRRRVGVGGRGTGACKNVSARRALAVGSGGGGTVPGGAVQAKSGRRQGNNADGERLPTGPTGVCMGAWGVATPPRGESVPSGLGRGTGIRGASGGAVPAWRATGRSGMGVAAPGAATGTRMGSASKVGELECCGRGDSGISGIDSDMTVLVPVAPDVVADCAPDDADESDDVRPPEVVAASELAGEGEGRGRLLSSEKDKVAWLVGAAGGGEVISLRKGEARLLASCADDVVGTSGTDESWLMEEGRSPGQGDALADTDTEPSQGPRSEVEACSGPPAGAAMLPIVSAPTREVEVEAADGDECSDSEGRGSPSALPAPPLLGDAPAGGWRRCGWRRRGGCSGDEEEGPAEAEGGGRRRVAWWRACADAADESAASSEAVDTCERDETEEGLGPAPPASDDTESWREPPWRRAAAGMR